MKQQRRNAVNRKRLLIKLERRKKNVRVKVKNYQTANDEKTIKNIK